MHDSITAAYTRYLQTIDPLLSLEADRDSRNHSKRAYWIKYRLTTDLRLKLAAVSEFAEFQEGPGEWLRLILHRLDWRRSINDAKLTFSRRYDERHAIGIDRAQHVPVRMQ